jgi:hypothetical protein
MEEYPLTALQNKLLRPKCTKEMNYSDAGENYITGSYISYIVTCMSDYQRGFGLEIKFIDHFNTRLVTTLNYSAIANLHILQITTAHSTPFQCAMSSPIVPW